LFAGLGVTLPLQAHRHWMSNFIGSIFGLLMFVTLGAVIVGLKVWYGRPWPVAIDRTLLKLLSWVSCSENRRRAFYTHAGHADFQRFPSWKVWTSHGGQRATL